jgi:prepilin-type N-terminal cleavage/methylation domain-containing protein
MKRGFTLIEVLVIIFIISVMMSILIPSLSRAREQAKIVVVNAELRQIGLALESYFDDNQKFPPTQEDCITGTLTNHLYQLPQVLVIGEYLPSMPRTEAMSTTMEDRFNRGHTYKYRSIGEVIKDRDIIDKWIKAKLWIPDNFPQKSSINPDEGGWYPNDSCWHPSQSPVTWVVFSLGPDFSQQWLEEKLGPENRYPVPKELWYTQKHRKGFLVRMQLKNGTQIGSFEAKQ